MLSLASATDAGGVAAPSLALSVSGRLATTTGNGDLRVCAEGHVGDVSGWPGFAGLEAIEDITMLCVPDLVTAGQQGPSTTRRQGRAAGDDRGLRAGG
ncbi:hypothetical protein ACGFI4_25410 [Micromonospora carbonacea]|uniref:hypothetical protein n=1 Tax=Micromonospora carbonacea TaxID=47853 RepID=UPI003714966A